jgi:hypothetical protein
MLAIAHNPGGLLVIPARLLAWLVLGVICLPFAMMLGGCDQNKEKKANSPPPRGEPVAEVDAGVVWWEYGENALAADGKYKGKTLAIKANVRKITPAADGGYLADLGATLSYAGVPRNVYNRMSVKEKKWYNEGPPPNILGLLASGAEKDFAALKVPMPPQDTIVLIGICRGMQTGADAYKGYTVTFERCILQKQKQ